MPPAPVLFPACRRRAYCPATAGT